MRVCTCLVSHILLPPLGSPGRRPNELLVSPRRNVFAESKLRAQPRLPRGPPGSRFPLPSCPFNQTTMSNHNSLGTRHIQLSIDFYGVVINFLSVTGPGHNIRRLEAACSPAINHEQKKKGEKKKKTRQRRAVALVSSWIIYGSYDPEQTGPQWPPSIKKTWESFVCCWLPQCLEFLAPPTHCTIALVTDATRTRGWFA